MRRTLLALAVVLVLPASAEAAPPWSVPRDVSGPFTFVDGLWAGNNVIGWRSEDGEAGAPAGRVGDPAFFAGFEAVAIVRGSELRVAIREPGRFGSGRRIVKRPGIRSPSLAANERSKLALAWFEDRGTANDRVYVALGGRGRAWSKPIRLATGRIRSVSAAIGSRGDVLVAWDARGTVRARFKRRGHGFGRVETIRSDPAFFARLRTAVASSGRAYVAWAAQFLSEGGDRGPGFYEAAVRPAGRRFRRAQRLDRVGADRYVGGLDLGLTGRGRAIVAWASGRVRVAEAGASGGFGAPQDLSTAPLDEDLTPPGGVDLFTTDGGARLVTWTVAGPAIQAAFAPGGGAFGPPEDVGAGEQARAGWPFMLAWQDHRPDGVYVQRAERTG
jgi:murein DD-endopeptidase MepM/ murein hydrolase activator NlpD